MQLKQSRESTSVRRHHRRCRLPKISYHLSRKKLPKSKLETSKNKKDQNFIPSLTDSDFSCKTANQSLHTYELRQKSLRDIFASKFKVHMCCVRLDRPGCIWHFRIFNRSIALAEQSKEEKHKVLIIGGGTAGTKERRAVMPPHQENH